MNPVLLGFLKSIVFIYEILAYIPYLIFANPYNKIRESEKVKAKRLNSDPDSPYRSVESFNDLKSPLFNDCNTLDDVFRIVAGLYPTKKCYGTREVFAEEDEPQSNGKVFKKLVLGDYHWETFEEVNRRIHHFGSGLQALGLKPGQVFVIFAETRAEWQIAAQAGFKFNFPVATIYATLGEEALIHGINETDVSVVVTSSELLPRFKTILNGCPKVTHVIYMENKWKRISPIGYKDGVQILSFSEVEALGATPDSLAVTPDKPKSDDLAVIMYTSGSTGQPKGVMISHLNLITAAAGIVAPVPEPSPDDVYIGYLPLAHVLELAAELACMSYGIAIGYSSAFTLSDQSTKIKKGCKGDASVLQPTLFATVPLIFDRVYKAVIEKVNEGGEFSKTLFHFAYDYKMNCLETGYSTPIIDKLIFGKIRKLLGGRVRAMFCGGAPLSPDTHRFMNICFCCPVLQGYGLTETCGGAAVMRATDLMVGHVGAPIRYVDIKLKNWEEGNYRNTDKPNARGEIIIGGKNVSLGYFKNEEKTQEDFFNENGKRWFATGDIGEFLPNGSLKIIDRKKDLVKLQAGEYVSLSKVETLLKTCPYVDNICVYGDSLKTFVIGLLVPNQKNLLALANDLGKDTSNLEQLYQDKDINKAILSGIIKHGKQMKLERFEIPEKLFIVQEIWLPDTGLVTEAFKLKRKVIQDFYQTVIDRMYA